MQPITIVSGLPRSGTSMMMRMIAAAGLEPLTDNLRIADEDNPNGYYEFEPVKKTKQDPSWLATAGGKVVKMVHLLLQDLPPGYEYRVVLMDRNLDEVLASQRKMLERSGRRSADPEMLKRVYTTQLAGLRQWLNGQRHIRWIEVGYNRILNEPAAEAARVAEFLGLPNKAAAMAASVDSKLYRNRRP